MADVADSSRMFGTAIPIGTPAPERGLLGHEADKPAVTGNARHPIIEAAARSAAKLDRAVGDQSKRTHRRRSRPDVPFWFGLHALDQENRANGGYPRPIGPEVADRPKRPIPRRYDPPRRRSGRVREASGRVAPVFHTRRQCQVCSDFVAVGLCRAGWPACSTLVPRR